MPTLIRQLSLVKGQALSMQVMSFVLEKRIPLQTVNLLLTPHNALIQMMLVLLALQYVKMVISDLLMAQTCSVVV